MVEVGFSAAGAESFLELNEKMDDKQEPIRKERRKEVGKLGAVSTDIDSFYIHGGRQSLMLELWNAPLWAFVLVHAQSRTADGSELSRRRHDRPTVWSCQPAAGTFLEFLMLWATRATYMQGSRAANGVVSRAPEVLICYLERRYHIRIVVERCLTIVHGLATTAVAYLPVIDE